jgi:hypothetical protein
MTALSAATILTVAWGAFAFGAVYPWAYLPLATMCCAIGITGCVRARGIGGLHATCLAATLVLIAGTLQTIPLPDSLVTWISPASGRFHAAIAGEQPGVWPVLTTSGAGVAEQEAERRTLSVHPPSTSLGLVLFAAFVVFTVGLAAGTSDREIVSVTTGVAAVGAALAMAAIVQRAFSTASVYGLWTPKEAGNIFGPFVNRNHFAGWMVMAMPLAWGRCGDLIAGSFHAQPDWRRRVLLLSSPRAGLAIVTCFAVSVMMLSVLISGSRSGRICIVVGLLVFAWVTRQLWRRGGQPQRAVKYVALLVFIVAGWAGVDSVVGRFAAAQDQFATRIDAWSDGLRVTRDFALAGSGLNTYPFVSPSYQRSELGFTHGPAHNDYLQLAAEGGLLVGLPAALLVIAAGRRVWLGLRFRGEHVASRWCRIGAVAGLGAIGVQEMFEFSLQIPANAVLCSVLTAMAIRRPLQAAGSVT